ncbi:MAG: hypothetical protein AMXMBFR16_11040 [Candidatus Uhrbacteria bacterium]
MPTKTLNRRPATGFVNYPKDWSKRVVEGTARFRTKCDMLIGPCSCGHVHQEHDGWVREYLENYGCDIQTLGIAPEDDGTYRIPRYWQRPRGHEDCNVLVGPCRCGRTHNAREVWVRQSLSDHYSTLVGCTDLTLPVSGNVEHETDDEGGCTCDDCRRARRLTLSRSRYNNNTLDRRTI